MDPTSYQKKDFVIAISSKLTNVSIAILTGKVNIIITTELKNSLYEHTFTFTSFESIDSILKSIAGCIESITLKYYDVEVFTRADFEKILENPDKRLLSRKKICLYLESKRDDKEIIINDTTIDNVTIQTSNAKIKNYIGLEEIWFNIGKQIGYDEWDISTARFIPIDYKLFIDDINEFCTYWNIDKAHFQLSTFSDENIILRNVKEWAGIEYLILDNTTLTYVGADASY